jgi:hypothetical protein
MGCFCWCWWVLFGCFSVVLGFELRASSLLGTWSTICATPPAFFSLVIFSHRVPLLGWQEPTTTLGLFVEMGNLSDCLPGLTSNHSPSDVCPPSSWDHTQLVFGAAAETHGLVCARQELYHRATPQSFLFLN